MRMEFIRCSFTHCVGVYFHVTGRQLLLVARFFFQRGGRVPFLQWAAHTGTASAASEQPVASGRPTKRRRFLAFSDCADADPRPRVPTSPQAR